jgi:hypothetical protein
MQDIARFFEAFETNYRFPLRNEGAINYLSELQSSDCASIVPATEYEDIKSYAPAFIEKGKSIEEDSAAGIYEDGKEALDAIEEKCPNASLEVRLSIRHPVLSVLEPACRVVLKPAASWAERVHPRWAHDCLLVAGSQGVLSQLC